MDKIRSLFRNDPVKALLLSTIIIVACSWIRVYYAGTLQVDGHGLGGISVFVVFFSMLGALGLYSINLYKVWKEKVLSYSDIKLLSYILAGIFSLMLPMLSNDIFSLLTYGDAANRGVDVYTDIHSNAISPFYDFVSHLWKTAPCVYGPICLSTARIAAYIGGGHLLLALAAYKVLALLWAILFIEIMCRISKLFNKDSETLMVILLNPLLLIQGLAQLHCDGIVITLSGCMIYFFLSKKWHWAFVFAGLAMAAKMSFVLMLPFLVIGLFLEKNSWLSFCIRIGFGMCITVAVFSLMYLPYYTSPQTFQAPFKFLFAQDPAKSIAEVVGDIVYFAPSVISGSENHELQGNVKVKASTSRTQLEAWLLVKKICQVFALLISAFVFFGFWIGQRDSRQWMKVFLRLLFLFLLFYSHVFYPWYLLMVIPFLWFEDDVQFMQWLFALISFAIVQDFICFIKHDTIPYYIILGLTFISILIFFWRFKRVYFTSVKAI